MANNTPAQSWNDPPVLKFDATASSTKPRLLKKRVYSSLDKHGQPPSPHKDPSEASLIPPTVSETNLPVKSEDHTVSENSEQEGIKENCDIPSSDTEVLIFVSTTLKSILEESPEKCERSIKEIERRLNIMEKSWDSELSKEVKHMMFKLAQGLYNGNIDAALKIHCSLMVQNVREVKNWMVGVKKIIEMRKENLKLSTIISEELPEKM